MKVLEGFETETGITEDYDPQGDKESGYYSRAFIVKYAEWLEKKLVAMKKLIDRWRNAERKWDKSATMFAACDEGKSAIRGIAFGEGSSAAYKDCADALEATQQSKEENPNSAEKTQPSVETNTTKATIALLDKYENSKSRYHLEGLSELRMFRRFVEEMAQQ